MTTFQPGDVVRLTGMKWGRHYPHLSGTEQTIVSTSTLEASLPYFLDGARPMHVGAAGWEAVLIQEPTLSPQAVLDAILEGVGMASDSMASDWDDYPLEAYGQYVMLTARKVDGHWQVKSVGGGE